MPEESRSLDVLGVKGIAESINKLTSSAVDGAAAFLSRICLPAAEEFGLLLRDRVRSWRVSNIASITQKAEQKLNASKTGGEAHAHPRLIFKIIEAGSWIDDDMIQEMWSGLISSSCSESGDDESNLIFINLLSELTKVQARILNYACENATKKVSPNSLVTAENLTLKLDRLMEIAQENDIYRLDRELDHLHSLALIRGGFYVGPSTNAELTPHALGIQLYVRSQGSRQSPVDYFELEIPKTEEAPQEAT